MLLTILDFVKDKKWVCLVTQINRLGIEAPATYERCFLLKVMKGSAAFLLELMASGFYLI